MDILTHCRKSLKKSGLIVLDTHHNPWDILLTARHIRLTLNPAKIYMPLAGYARYVPVMREIIGVVAKAYQIEFIPVYRRDEYQPVNLLMRWLCWFYPRELSREIRELANKEYVKKTLTASEIPGNVIIVAPYGSPIWFGGKVKYGARKLIESPTVKVLSCTKWSFPKIKFITYLGRYRADLGRGYQLLTQKA